MKQSILIVLFMFSLAYLTGVFINADINIAEWTTSSREHIGGLCSAITVLALSAAALDRTDKPKKQ